MKKTGRFKIWGGLLLAVCCVCLIFAWGYHHQKEEVPVADSNMAVYPQLNLEELTERADVIVVGKVSRIKERETRKLQTYGDVALTEKTEVMEYSVIPAVIDVTEVVKGEIQGSTYTYYQDGDVLKEGETVLLFASETAEGWGYQSVFPVVNDKVVLNSAAEGYFDLQKNGANTDSEIAYDMFIRKLKEWI